MTLIGTDRMTGNGWREVKILFVRSFGSTIYKYHVYIRGSDSKMQWRYGKPGTLHF